MPLPTSLYASAAIGSSDLISPEDLAQRLDGDSGLRLLDVRYSQATGSLKREYETMHIPGAVFVDVEAELCGPEDRRNGTQPLPRVGDLQASMRLWGLRTDSTVVVYSGRNGIAAARAWWLLRWAGHERVRVLRTGFDGWVRRRLPTSSDPVDVPQGDVVVRPASVPVLDDLGAVALGETGNLIDARASSKFQATSSADARYPAGRIPGAVNLPSTSLLQRNGDLKSPDEIYQLLSRRGIDLSRTVGVYCGGGIASPFVVLALSEIGISAVLYAAAWSGYVTNPALPIELAGGRDGG